MKLHEYKEFWTYQTVSGKVQPVYFVDGIFRTEHMTAQYLMDQYSMDFEEACKYIHEIDKG